MLSHVVSPILGSPRQQRAYDEANAAFYAHTDWALDISEAEFTDDIEIRGIPAHLIRRDPTTQFVVTRQRAIEGRWRQVNLENTHWGVALGFLASGVLGPIDAAVFVAPKRGRDFHVLLDGLKRLRDEGIAEPD